MEEIKSLLTAFDIPFTYDDIVEQGIKELTEKGIDNHFIHIYSKNKSEFISFHFKDNYCHFSFDKQFNKKIQYELKIWDHSEFDIKPLIIKTIQNIKFILKKGLEENQDLITIIQFHLKVKKIDEINKQIKKLKELRIQLYEGISKKPKKNL